MRTWGQRFLLAFHLGPSLTALCLLAVDHWADIQRHHQDVLSRLLALQLVATQTTPLPIYLLCVLLASLTYLFRHFRKQRRNLVAQ